MSPPDRCTFATLPPPRAAGGFGFRILALVVLVAGFHLLTIQEGAGWYGDSYQYVLHAENLVEGRPYGDTGYIQNADYYLAPATYPAGFPVLLAPVVALFGTSAQAIEILLLTVWLLTVVALAYLFRDELPDHYVYGLVLVLGLHPYFWAFKQDPLADLPFFLGCVLSLLCYEQAVRSQAAVSNPRRWLGLALMAGAASAFAAWTRPLALVMLPCLLLYDLVRSRRVTWPLAATGVSFCVVYGLCTLLVDVGEGVRVARLATEGGGGDGGYSTLFYTSIFEQLGRIPVHIVERLEDYARASFVLWYMGGPGGAVVKHVLTLLSLFPVGLGLWSRVRHRFGSIEAFVLLYALSLLPWSFSGVRYLVPLIPFYYFYLFVGLRHMHGWKSARGRRTARIATVAVVAALVVVYAVRYEAQLFETVPRPGLADRAADPVYVYLRESTPPTTTFVTSGDPRASVFFSRRAAAVGPRDVSRWAEFAERVGASYLLVGAGERGRAAARMTSPVFEPVVSSARWDLYRLRPASARPHGASSPPSRRGEVRQPGLAP